MALMALETVFNTVPATFSAFDADYGMNPVRTFFLPF